MVLIAQISTFSSDFFTKCIKLNHQMLLNIKLIVLVMLE
ncbi:hypothetical protein ECDEC3E_4884 [Escherichia coli DEC3E]|nr:hypothetical protein ECDEC3E_4884 [Escherichia coli DEC3E]